MRSISENNQRGIALLIVLSSLMILTVSVVEFAFSSRINYQLAVQNKQRLQATYLAQSALNFSRLILKYSKEAESLIEKASETAGGAISLEPLYRMIPLSSELLRGMMSGGLTGLIPGADEGEGALPETAEGGEGEAAIEEKKRDIQASIGMMDKEKAEAFLNFDGDFSLEITEEQTKYDLNKIAGMEPGSKNYDERKRNLLSILLLSDFKDLFENQEQDAPRLVHALADWVDANGFINEFENVQRGGEDGLYTDVSYKVKNGKYLTLSELRLVAGVNDKIYKALIPYVTVYNGTDKVNVCLSDEAMLKALIYHYTHDAGCTSPIDFDDEEKMTELVGEVMAACPDPGGMAAAINSKLGLSDLDVAKEDEDKEKKEGTTVVEGEKATGCLFQFKDLISKDNNVFTVKATGEVGDTRVVLTVVMNTEPKSPDQWKYYYYKID